MKTQHFIPEVAKEKLTGLLFPADDVLPLYDQRAERKRLLQRALDFGNYAQYKVALLFEDAEGIKRVETTIWDLDDENVYLKNRVKLPLCRILEVKI